MKICPTCRRSYATEGLNFCRDDGTPLQNASSSLAEGRTKLIGGDDAPRDDFEPTKVFSPPPLRGNRAPTAPFGDAPRRRAARKAVTSLAILPLENASDDPEMEYLSDGITESIINTLSQLPKLRVMARSTVFGYKGKSVNPRAVGRELGVRAVLTGRVIQFGDRLVIKTE
ncbi:MAG: hypothetical protein LC746_15665, partial [Acidobacteria bacterium]|nr:hypothetical protein [Acidobacteriota bacterium]